MYYRDSERSRGSVAATMFQIWVTRNQITDDCRPKNFKFKLRSNFEHDCCDLPYLSILTSQNQFRLRDGVSKVYIYEVIFSDWQKRLTIIDTRVYKSIICRASRSFRRILARSTWGSVPDLMSLLKVGKFLTGAREKMLCNFLWSRIYIYIYIYSHTYTFW